MCIHSGLEKMFVLAGVSCPEFMVTFSGLYSHVSAEVHCLLIINLALVSKMFSVIFVWNLLVDLTVLNGMVKAAVP